MTSFGYCPRCKEYMLGPQNCKCELFLGWYDDTKDIPEEAREIYAVDYERAAETMAKRWFDCEFDTTPMDIFVKRPDDPELQHFIVEIEITPHFHATKKYRQPLTNGYFLSSLKGKVMMNTIKDLLSLIDIDVSIDEIKSWTPEHRQKAVEYAATVYAIASDNDGEMPERPAFLPHKKIVIHWGLPQFPDLWNGKGMCGVECLPEHTSAGIAITCPECLRLFREQNPHIFVDKKKPANP